jgi:hypothetical protein
VNAELIRYARKHHYEIAEGFCDDRPENDGQTGEISAEVESALESYPAARAMLEQQAEELAEAAQVPLEVAESAIMNLIISGQLKKMEN